MSEWQPIETAPKDGTKILVACAYGGVEISEWCELERFHWEHVDGNLWRKVEEEPSCFWNSNHPTHWMPLPPPPPSTKEKE